MWPCSLKLEEEKSKHTGLTQQNSFSPPFLHSLLVGLVKGTAEICACKRERERERAECNKYDLTAAPSLFLIAQS